MNIAIQQLLYDTLVQSGELNQLLASFTYSNGDVVPCVFNDLPQTDDESVYPCVVIDAITSNQNDTDTTNGFDATVMIHTWSISPSNVIVSNIQDVIYSLLHRKKGGNISGISCELSEILRDPDGISRHGVQRFRIFYEKVD